MTQVAVAPAHPLSGSKRMNRFDLMKRLVAKLKHDEAVVGGIGHTNFDLWAAGPRPQNFYMLGSMGLAIPIAFGVALAQPDRRVIAVEGDGSLLMELSCLATVGMIQPKNLSIIVMDNSSYLITGGQPTASANTCDFVGVAKACGIPDAHWAADEAGFESLVDKALLATAPFFIGTRIDGEKAAGQTERDPDRIKNGFMMGIGARKQFGS